jgi:hypothetical protein
MSKRNFPSGTGIYWPGSRVEVSIMKVIRKNIILVIVVVGASLLIAAGCRVPAHTGLTTAPTVTHAVDVRFQNCVLCHIRDLQAATPFMHAGFEGYQFTRQECTVVGCHPLLDGTYTRPESPFYEPTIKTQ